jgi:hypothetical protein
MWNSSELFFRERFHMSTPVSAHTSLIQKLRLHLKAERYSPSVQRSYPVLANHFLDYCDRERVPIESVRLESVRLAHVTQFLQKRYRLFRRRHGESPPFHKWRQRYTSAVHMLLRLVHGRWPIADLPATRRPLMSVYRLTWQCLASASTAGIAASPVSAGPFSPRPPSSAAVALRVSSLRAIPR